VKRYVTDTQCLLWYMAEDRRLPRAVRPIFQAADEGHAQILVPSIVLVEAIFLLQRQRVSEAVIRQLMQLSEEADSNFGSTGSHVVDSVESIRRLLCQTCLSRFFVAAGALWARFQPVVSLSTFRYGCCTDPARLWPDCCPRTL